MMKTNTVYGGCAKHPGNSLIDCIECFFEHKMPDLTPKNKTSAEQIVEGISDILFFGKGKPEENEQKAVELMETVLKKLTSPLPLEVKGKSVEEAEEAAKYFAKNQARSENSIRPLEIGFMQGFKYASQYKHNVQLPSDEEIENQFPTNGGKSNGVGENYTESDLNEMAHRGAKFVIEWMRDQFKSSTIQGYKEVKTN